MKKLMAFLLALLLAAGSAAGIHSFCQGKVKRDSHSFAVWSSEKKFLSWQGLAGNLDSHVVPVFGSSEIQHGRNTKFHPAQVFADTQFQPMLIGAGYYQSLNHAITLASLGDQVTSKKAVLLLAPQWFRGHGVKAEAFASRFSEIQFLHMLDNSQISGETKQYLIDRTQVLLEKDPKTLARVKQYAGEASGQKLSIWEKTSMGIYKSFLREKDLCQTVMAEEMARIPSAEAARGHLMEEPDWSTYEQEAQKMGEAQEQNPYYMEPKAWKKKEALIRKGKVKRDQVTDGYKSREETEDLKAFLAVCREMEIQPLVVMLPVNGYWFDYTGYGEEARAKYYGRIRTLLEDEQVSYVDLSGEEYTKYFFEDGIHPSGKGWTRINEILYQFYQEDRTQAES